MIVIVIRCNSCRVQFAQEFAQTAGSNRITRAVESSGWRCFRVSSLVHYCPRCAARIDKQVDNGTRQDVNSLSGGTECPSG